jgi:selenocysteine lyase/cysteine desulfurase
MSQRDVFAFRTKHLELAPAARRFEGGTPPIPNIYQARPALDLLVRVGMENVAAQIERLTRAFLQGARDLHIQSKTPADSVGPLVVLRSKDAAALVGKLMARGIVTSSRLDGVRFAFHVYNTMEDVHTALAALEENLDLLVSAC